MDKIFNFFSSNTLSFILITVVVLITVLIIVLALMTVFHNKNLAARIVAKLARASHLTEKLEDCSIQNLPTILNFAREESFPLLEESLRDMAIDSQKLFENKWTTDPKDYIDREHLLTKRQFTRFSREVPFQFLAGGLTTSSLFIIIALLSDASVRTVLLPFSLLPAIASIIFFFILFYVNNYSRLDLDRSIHDFTVSVKKHLPVFSELAGSAVLVDAFIEYDRKMERAVDQFTNAVDNLLNKEMVNALSSSVDNIFNLSIIPSIQRAEETLVRLATEIENRQNTGMKDLVDHFLKETTGHLNNRFADFFTQLDAYTKQLHASNSEVTVALQTLDTYKSQSQELDATLVKHIESVYDIEKKFDTYLDNFTDSHQKLAFSCEKMVQLQTGTTGSFSTQILNLNRQILEFSRDMKQSISLIQEESDKTRGFVEILLKNQEELLGNYQALGKEFTDESLTVKDQATLLNQNMNDLNQQLVQSVGVFNQSMVNSVNDILKDMDKGISEISDRLSVTAREISDTLHNRRV